MRMLKNLTAGRGLRAALLLTAASAAATAAIAQTVPGREEGGAPLRMRSDYFGYAATVSPRVGYTDNIFLAPDGLEQSSALLSTQFSGAAIYSSKRVTAVVSGDLDFTYLTEGSDFGVNQRIGAASTFTGVENLLYVDVAGSTSRQLLGENARFSQNINAARNQRANVHTLSASPYLYREFSDRSSAQLRYRFSQVFIDDDNSAANPFGGDFLNDSRAHEVTASYDTGGKFDRFRLALTGYGNRTTEDGSIILPSYEFEQGSAVAEAQFALTDDFALSGAVGYDEIETDTAVPLFDDEALSGLFWRAGFSATPGRKTFIRAEYGRRYDDEFIDADISYEISTRLRFQAGASQTFETRAQQIGAGFFNQQRQLLDFAERLREGDALSPEAVIETANRFASRSLNAQTTGIGVSKNVYAQLTGAYDRTEIAATGFYQDTDFSFRRNKTLAASLDVRRELSRKLSAYGGVFWRRAETTIDQTTCQTSPFLFGFDVTAPLFDPVTACLDFAFENGRTNTAGARIGSSYRLYSNLSAFGEYAHTRRFADSPLLEYDENAFLAGVTLDF